MITLLMFLLWEPFSLPGTAKPIFAFENGSGGCWLMRQEDGEALVPWLISESGSAAVDLPAGVRYVGFHPEKPLLALFFESEMRLAEVRSGRLKVQGNPRKLEPALHAAHPWLTAKTFRIQKKNMLSFVAGSQWYLVDWDGSGPIQAQPAPRPLKAQDQGLERAGEIEYLTPAILQGGDTLYWMDDAGWFARGPGSQTITTGGLPKLGNMEEASALPLSFRQQPIWFVFGGDRGSLKSFGWRLLDADGAQTADGRGIVTRFGAMEQGDAAYVHTFTVPSKIRAHLWSAISGAVAFTCTRVVIPKKGQPRVHELEFKMEETKKRWFGLAWHLDWNGDGAPDLLAGDDKRELRLFHSQPDGSLSDRPARPAANGDELVFLDHGVLICHRKGGDWKVEVMLTP